MRWCLAIFSFLFVCCHKEKIDNPEMTLLVDFQIKNINYGIDEIYFDIEVIFKNISSEIIALPNNYLNHVGIYITSATENIKLPPCKFPMENHTKMPMLLLYPGDTYKKRTYLNENVITERNNVNNRKEPQTKIHLPNGKYSAKVFFEFPMDEFLDTVNSQSSCLGGWEGAVYRMMENTGNIEVVHASPVLFDIFFPPNTSGQNEKGKFVE